MCAERGGICSQGRREYRVPFCITAFPVMSRPHMNAIAIPWLEIGKPARVRFAIIYLTLLTLCTCLHAQDRDAPLPLTVDLTPIVSYGSRMSLAIQPVVPGTNPHVVVNASPGYGFAVGARIREGDLLEFRWSTQDSYIEIRDGRVAVPRSRMTLNQYYCDFTHEYVIRHPAPWLRPFIIASVGATSMASEANSGSIYFSAGIGGGVKLLVSHHLGFRIQAQWLSTLIDPHGTAICVSGCELHLTGTLGSQAELTVGPVLRF